MINQVPEICQLEYSKTGLGFPVMNLNVDPQYNPIKISHNEYDLTFVEMLGFYTFDYTRKLAQGHLILGLQGGLVDHKMV